MQVSQTFRSDTHNTLKYAEISGDWNPLHTEDQYVRREETFSDENIVHGAHILGWFSAMLNELGADLDAEIVLLNMDVDFENALAVGDAAEVTATLPADDSGLVADVVEVQLEAEHPENGTVYAAGTATIMVDESVSRHGGN